MKLSDPVTNIKGVGETLAKKFAYLKIRTIADLLDYFPRAYDDYSNIESISKIKPGKVSLRAKITNASGHYLKGRLHITEAIASDETDSLRLIWFNQPYRAASIKNGQDYLISGDYQLRRGRFSIINPSIELASDLLTTASPILAVYRETKGLTSRQIRQAVSVVLKLTDELSESLPSWVIKDNGLISLKEAIKSLHNPSSKVDLDKARERLGFEEVFSLSLASLINKQQNQSEHSLKIAYEPELATKFSSSLPFKMTDAQRLSVMRIYKDMEKNQPMNRLIEGDVGSGKTVVATMAGFMAMNQGYQVALMAPTEILARQHAVTIYELLKPLGLSDQVLLILGSMTKAQKDKAYDSIAKNKANFLIGTHALIQEKVDFNKLALVVIDEQHRFGVDQRKALMTKAGHMPHVLSLTATPIPRSLALTLYGELDISVLSEKPVGRLPITTDIVTPIARQRVYKEIDNKLNEGQQMFVVCPLISQSEALEARSVEKVYEELSKGYFKHRRIGLLHGKLKADDKQAIMHKFIDKKYDILVSTTVIEVGVDVPNATIMMIESAERFGLAQLHQLRGRVGRSNLQSYCYLMLDDSAPPSRRLRAMKTTNDGFKLAELDLEIRGPGAIYGTLQHGAIDLRIAKLTDTQLISRARLSAQNFLDKKDKLSKYSQLEKAVTRLRTVTNLN